MADAGEMPQALLDEPHIPSDLIFVWDAFWRLSTDRPLGMGGPGPIPNLALLAEADRAGMGTDEAAWFAALVVAMDGIYLGWIADQRSDGAPDHPTS